MTASTIAANRLRTRDCPRETWLFGYASLIFRCDFPHGAREPASVRGWQRRFWQGSHDHRGTPTAPGRVATLVRCPGAVCRGMAYRISSDVFSALDYREKNGYLRVEIDLIFDDRRNEPGVVYIASESNTAYLGPAPERDIARHIVGAAGPSGDNAEYVTELAAALRSLDADDPHVFAIEREVLRLQAMQGSRSDPLDDADGPGLTDDPHEAVT